MKVTVELDGHAYTADLKEGINISIGVGGDKEVSAYGIPRSKIETFEADGFIGDVNKGGSCNVKNILFNPHGNGTHTECVGHIAPAQNCLNDLLSDFHLSAQLVTVDCDSVIDVKHLSVFDLIGTDALIIRTLPNNLQKISNKYAGTHPIYFSDAAMKFIVTKGFKHLVVDLPSVDAETSRSLSSHKIFWEIEKEQPSTKTITELVYIPNEIKDGLYLMNLMIPNMHCDALPSQPILFPLR